MVNKVSSIHWLEPGQEFPPVTEAFEPEHEYSGLLAAGGSLDLATLRSAYGQGIFPWFSDGQPILWWSPDPRMVLHVSEFELHRSLRRVLSKFQNSPKCEIRIDTEFEQVIRNCSQSPRHGQQGTWIIQDMIEAYCELHRHGLAHSVETWINGELSGGLYCVAIGHAVFGESMFTRVTDASKIALSALVCLCKYHGVKTIDCQQNTAHLASLGAREIPRKEFIAQLEKARTLASFAWQFDSIYWNQIFQSR